MQQKELKELNENNELKEVIALNQGGFWNIVVSTAKETHTVIRSARGGQREFKTLDAVDAMLNEINIKSFTVL